MSKDLYFIPIIAEALQAPNAEEALCRAFEQIRSLGQKAEYKQGLLQFEEFIRLVNHYRGQGPLISSEETMIKTLMIELATDTFEGAGQERQVILDAISSRRDWKDRYDQLVADIERLNRTTATTRLALLRDGKPVGLVEVIEGLGRGMIDNVTAAHYSLEIESGRVIWQEALTEQDLVWTEAFPGQPLPLAADTGELQTRATRQFNLLAGEIVLQVFAGLESGSIEIIVNTSRNPR
jgi:hypothetical protein